MTRAVTQVLGGRYALRRQIGQGGMGAVWLAVDQVLGREVAAKRVGLFPGGSSPDLRGAQREAKLAARLNHPHVVAVFDFVTEGEEQWLIMEHVDGTDLAVLAQHGDGLLPDEAAMLLAQVASALTAAHEAGIVHRDVKPSNVLVTGEGVAKLADFGIARARDSTMTLSGMVTGSPAYLAPEVASGGPATEASDVWSLGATLYYALIGRPPYEADNALATMYRIVHEEPPRLDGAGWPADLLEHTMARDPADRWSMSRVLGYLGSSPSEGEVAPTPVPEVAPVAETTRISVEPPQVVGPASRDEDERDGRRWVLPLAVGVAVLLGGALALWLLIGRAPAPNTDRDPAAADSPRSSTTRSSSPPESSPSAPSSPRSSPAPSTPPASTAPPPSPPASSPAAQPAAASTPARMRTFVEQYVALAVSDPEAAWQQLTPTFQQACCDGSAGNYVGYWNTIEDASLRDVRADPGSMQVSYVITWYPEDRPAEDEQVTLGLVEQDGDYLIDYEL